MKILNKKNSLKSKGFTFIEVMIVLLLISIVSLMSYPSIDRLISIQKHDSIVQELYMDLKKAKFYAIQKGVNTRFYYYRNKWEARDMTNNIVISERIVPLPEGTFFRGNYSSIVFTKIGQIKFGNNYVSNTYFEICSVHSDSKIFINALSKMRIEDENC